MKLSLAVFCLALATAAGAQTNSLPAMTAAPLLDCQGLPCVDATAADGRHLRLTVDTGNVASFVDTAAARGLARTPAMGRNGKPVPGYFRAVLPGLHLGGVDLGDVNTYVGDLKTSMEKGQMPRADGDLAYPAFQDRLVELDFAQHVLRVSAPLRQAVACAGACGKLELITFGHAGPPIVVVSGFEVNRRAVSAQLDSLYSGSVLVYPQAVDKLKLAGLAREATAQEFFPFTDGGVHELRATAAEEGFGGTAWQQPATVYFATPGVHVPDGLFDATVGMALLRGHRVRLDFHDHWIAVD